MANGKKLEFPSDPVEMPVRFAPEWTGIVRRIFEYRQPHRVVLSVGDAGKLSRETLTDKEIS